MDILTTETMLFTLI